MNDLSRAVVIEELNKKGIENYEVVYMDTVDSTNTFAMQNADQDRLCKAERALIIADEQSAGKGRLGRSFESGKNKGIYATLVVRPDKKTYEVANITLIVALAVVKAFDSLGVTGTLIKWPNDVILGGKKLCGILTEMKNDGNKVRFVAIGIGINVDNEEFTEELMDKATSVYMATGKRIERKLILSTVVDEFERVYDMYLKCADLAFMMDEYNARLVNVRGEVVVDIAGVRQRATQLGIDANGALKVIMDGEEKSVTSGEVSVRGVLGYV